VTFIFPRSHLSGLTLSVAVSSSTFNVAAGQAADSGNAVIMNLATSLAKTTGAWAAGAGGALDTGAIAASTWYHAHLIQSADASLVDILISLSATAPTMPVGYTLFRRIGSLLTDSVPNWWLFTDIGDKRIWASSFADVNVSNLGTTATTYTLTGVPPGISVEGLFRGDVYNASGAAQVLVTSLYENSVAQDSPEGAFTLASYGNAVRQGSHFQIQINASQQIRAVAASASTFFAVATYGYIDRRGRDA
jgi:hypothetical protein